MVWLFGVLFFGMRPYLNLLPLCVSAMGRLGSLREEPGRSLERHSPPLLFCEELRCKAQSCYALVEGEVGRKCLSAGHGVDLKSFTHLYSYPVWHRLEMGPVSEEMNLSVISYTPMRSCQSNVVARAGLAAADPGSVLDLVLVIAFPLHLYVRTLDLIVPSSSSLGIVSKNLCPFDLIPTGSTLTVRDNPLFWIAWITHDSRTWRYIASKQPWCELAQLEKSQAAGTAVLSQTEGSPRPYPVSDQPIADAHQKSTGAGQVQRYFLHFILPVSGNLEFRDFLSQGCIFNSAV